MTRLHCVLAAAVLAVVPLAPVTAANPVEIHVIASLTGSASFVGKGGVATLEALEETVDASGGIRGRPLHFVFDDDTSSPQVTIQMANALLGQAVVIDITSAASCAAILPLIKSGPVSYCMSNGVHPPAGSYMFTSAMWSNAMIATDLRYLRDRGLTKIALITSTDTTGQDAERSIDETLADPANKALGIVARQHFGISDISIEAQMTDLKAADPDVLIAWSTGTALGTLLRGIQAVGLTNLPVLTSAGNLTYVAMRQYASLLPPQLYFAALPPFAPEVVTDRATRTALEQYFNAIRKANLPADYTTVAIWDPAALLVEALRRLGPDADAPSIRAYLASLKGWSGVDGVYDFKTYPQRGLGPDNVILVRWDASKQGWVGVSRPGGAPLHDGGSHV